jgi:GT2 family glycosyltransferase
MKKMLFLNKTLKQEIKIVEENIDSKFYASYFLFPILISVRFASIHYCLLGWKKKLNPTNNFCTYYYIEKYSDIKEAGINPFSHYCSFGKTEKRSKNFETESEYFDLAKKFTFASTVLSTYLVIFFLKNRVDSRLFDSYFDVREYRRNVRLWKYAYFPFILKAHYLIKGSKIGIQPSQIYDSHNTSFNGTFIELLRGLYKKEFVGILLNNEYQKWILENENLTEGDAMAMIKQFEYTPLISIIMPVYNADIKYLKEAIQSVISQYYNNWELCIADDKSTDLELLLYLKELEHQKQVKVAFRNKNGHISACSNSALELAKGEFIALLDQDDLLSNNALFEVVRVLNENPEYKMIFSNEDKINESGKRFDPYFKKGWNYHLLLSQNFVSHLGVYDRSVVEGIGGFKVGYEGSQDYDLLLRVIEQINENEIKYINKFLYHWRAIEGSTALNVSEKNYAVNAGLISLQDHLDRTSQAALAVSASLPQFYRVKRKMTKTPLVSVLIPTRNHLEDLEVAVNSVLNNNIYRNFEILIIDNDSDDEFVIEYFKKISSEPDVKVISYSGVFNYSAINNFAAKKAKGELLLLLNNDIEAIDNTWLSEMVSQLLPDQVGIVGAKLLYPNDTIQHVGVEVGLGGVAGHIFNGLARDAPGDFGRAQLIQNCDAVTAACLLVKKDSFDQVGGLDEVNLKVAFNDVDLCLKIGKLGKKIIYTPYAELYHYESKSRGNDTDIDKIERFKEEIEYFNTYWKN